MNRGAAQGDLANQARLLRHALALVERSDLRLVRIGGADHLALLQRVLCSDVRRLVPGQAAPSALLTPKGRVVAALTLLRLDDEMLALVDATAAGPLVEQLERYVIADDVSAALDDRLAVLGVYGAGLPAVAGLAAVRDLAPYRHRRTEIGEIEVLALGDDELATAGVLLLLESARVEQLKGRLVGAGAALVELRAWDSCRIEAGTPRAGSELSPDYLILEAGQLARVSFDKGCYVGQEPVCRVHNRGQVQRMLVGLSLDGPRVPEPGEKLSSEQKQDAGLLTSVARSVALGHLVALGYVHRSAAWPGSRLTLPDGGGVTVEALPRLDGSVRPLTLPRFTAEER